MHSAKKNCMQCDIVRCEHALQPTEIRHSGQSREHGDGSRGYNLLEQNANKWGTGIIFIILGVYQHRTGRYKKEKGTCTM